MWLFALFITVPLIEIGIFIQVGSAIGLWPTLLVVVLTAVIGTQLMRAQGAHAMSKLRNSFGQMQDPTEPLAHGAMVLFSGALLLTPGFFTDAVGFALLVPAFRKAVFKHLRKRVNIQTFSMFQGENQSIHGQNISGSPRHPQHGEDDVIDSDFTGESPDKGHTHEVEKGPSGWTKH